MTLRPRLEPPRAIADATGRRDDVRALFREYADWLGVDLGFQGFDEELATLPGKYAPPGGRLFVALDGARVAGCIALRRFDATTGEIKRLYVRPMARGQGLGGALALKAIEAAREIGYGRLVLDTLEPMADARRLYASLGFREIPAYYANPLPGAIYMELVVERRVEKRRRRGSGRRERPSRAR